MKINKADHKEIIYLYKIKGKTLKDVSEIFNVSPATIFSVLNSNGIRKRDNQICMLCNIHREKLKTALHVHHINYDKLLSLPENCISLCCSCHMKTNNNRKHWTNFFQSLLSEKYDYIYSNSEVVIEFNGKEVR